MSKKVQKKIEQEIVNILAKNKTGLSAKQLSAELSIRKKNYHLFQKALNSLIYTRQIFKIRGSKKYSIFEFIPV